MTITNYMPTYDTHLFQNIDNEYIFYFEYDGIIYVFRNNNIITNYYNNRNRITNYDYIRYDYIRNY